MSDLENVSDWGMAKADFTRLMQVLRKYKSQKDLGDISEMKSTIDDLVRHAIQSSRDIRVWLGERISDQLFLLLRNSAASREYQTVDKLYDLIGYVYRTTECSDDALVSARLITDMLHPERVIDRFYSYLSKRE